MHAIDFWFDPVSPYAAIAFERAPEVLAGHSVTITYRPILFAGLLKHWGQLGPAELAPKRAWTYRHVTWLMREHGLDLQMPAMHPFDPLPLLRLAWACASPGEAALGTTAGVPGMATPNRRVAEAVLRHAWRGGADAGDRARLDALRAELRPSRDPASAEVKAALRAATDDAIARGVFGVPTFGHAGRLYWGLDGLALLAATLHAAPSALDDAAWQAADTWPVGAERPR
ncbi:MAG: DsbA family protein [Ideonella sp.]|jgi:2-hydroxychromene-2-carboxylate isomerase|nr:DsbA family protein [Ideonella sp.]